MKYDKYDKYANEMKWNPRQPNKTNSFDPKENEKLELKLTNNKC